jgi:hypothetical protein
MTNAPINLSTIAAIYRKGGDTALVIDMMTMTDPPASALPLILANYDISPRDLRIIYTTLRQINHYAALAR